MNDETLQFIKQQIQDLAYWGSIAGNADETRAHRLYAEKKAVEIIRTIHLNSVGWLGQFVQMFEEKESLNDAGGS